MPPDPHAPELLTDGSDPMGSLLRELSAVAPTTLPVLVTGPTGSGKELAARELHLRSGRRGELVPLNCSALSEGTLESELFGHVRGAFTGAARDRKGAVETADGGTLFLDEVADLSPRLQSIFLRVLQEREIRRVGSDRPARVDVRFVAATNRPLDDLVLKGQFRADLLFRLQGFVLRTPALEERRHEFPFLVPRLAHRIADRYGRAVPQAEQGLCEALAGLSWPGNIRQLLHCLERALHKCGNGPLEKRHFPELDRPPAPASTWAEATRAFQRRLLLDTLARHGFRVAETARALGLARPALYGTAQRLGIKLAEAKAGRAD